MSTWERGTRMGPLFVWQGLLGAPRGQTGRRPLGARRPFAFGAARLASPMSTCRAGNVAGGLLLHVADPRRAFLAGRGSERGLRFDVLALGSLRGLCLCCVVVGKPPKGDFEASSVTLWGI